MATALYSPANVRAVHLPQAAANALSCQTIRRGRVPAAMDLASKQIGNLGGRMSGLHPRVAERCAAAAHAERLADCAPDGGGD